MLSFKTTDLGYAMACDGVYVDSGKLKLTLSGLQKGKYILKTYHHSFQDLKNLFPYDLKVELKDAKGEFSYTSDDQAVGMYDANDMGERNPISVTNFIESDGANPVTITFETDKENAATWLNGLEFKQIK